MKPRAEDVLGASGCKGVISKHTDKCSCKIKDLLSTWDKSRGSRATGHGPWASELVVRTDAGLEQLVSVSALVCRSTGLPWDKPNWRLLPSLSISILRCLPTFHRVFTDSFCAHAIGVVSNKVRLVQLIC